MLSVPKPHEVSSFSDPGAAIHSCLIFNPSNFLTFLHISSKYAHIKLLFICFVAFCLLNLFYWAPLLSRNTPCILIWFSTAPTFSHWFTFYKIISAFYKIIIALYKMMNALHFQLFMLLYFKQDFQKCIVVVCCVIKTVTVNMYFYLYFYWLLQSLHRK